MHPFKYNQLRRLASRLALLVVLGFVTSVGLAWSIEELQVVRSLCSSVQIESAQQLIVCCRKVHLLKVNEYPGRTERSWSQVSNGHSRLSSETAEWLKNDCIIMVEPDQLGGLTFKDVYHPAWGLQPPKSGRVTITNTIEYASGFPLRCVWKWIGEYDKGGMIELPDPKGFYQPFPGISSRGLPYLPIPLGLAINTAFWGSAWWLTLLGIASVRKRSRIRKGRCTKCNYDLRGLSTPTCPECGSTVPSPLRGEDVTNER